MRARDHALKVAVLGTLKERVEQAYKAARGEAEAEFAEIRKDGTPQQEVMLADGEEIGLISIKAGTTEVMPDSATVLMDWCREHAPHAIEQYVGAGAFEMADVVRLIAEHFPNLVHDRIRASSLDGLRKQITETGGYLIDEEGEKAKVATVERRGPSGAFSYRPAAGAQGRIMAEWLAGNLREVAFGPLALPAPDGDES
jgi:hypothetical protein